MDDIIIYVSLITSCVSVLVGLFKSISHTRNKVKANEELTNKIIENYKRTQKESNESIKDLKLTIKRIEEEELKLKLAIDSIKNSSFYESNESKALLNALSKDEEFIKAFYQSYKSLDDKSKEELHSTLEKSSDKGLYRYMKKIASSVLDALILKA